MSLIIHPVVKYISMAIILYTGTGTGLTQTTRKVNWKHYAIDIVSKVWNADGPAYHMDLWINLLY